MHAPGQMREPVSFVLNVSSLKSLTTAWGLQPSSKSVKNPDTPLRLSGYLPRHPAQDRGGGRYTVRGGDAGLMPKAPLGPC